MKASLALLVASLLIPAAWAQSPAAAPAAASPFYVELAAGRSSVNVDCAGTLRCDRDGSHARATVGFGFAPNLAFEVSLAQLGRAEVSANLPPLGRVDLSAKLRSIGLGVAGQLPLDPTWSLTGRLGVASNKVTLDVSSGGERERQSETRTRPYLGVGLQYTLSPRTALGLGLERTDVEVQNDKGTVSSTALSLRHAF